MGENKKPKVKLLLPSLKYKAAFIAYFLPYVKNSRVSYNSWGKYANHSLIKNDFRGFVNFIKSQAKGKNLPEGYVPQTVFWLVKGRAMIGWLSLRHRLTPFLKKFGGHIGYEIAPKFRKQGYGTIILSLGLQKAKKMGITKILVTCDIDNIGSKKVIESNGGKFLNQARPDLNKPIKLRYAIKV